MSVARITNPNNYAVDVTQTIYVVDNNGAVGDYYQNSASIPASGTIELALPDTEDLKNEADAAPYHHARVIQATGPVHAHVSYEEQIDLPSVPKTEWASWTMVICRLRIPPRMMTMVRATSLLLAGPYLDSL